MQVSDGDTLYAEVDKTKKKQKKKKEAAPAAKFQKEGTSLDGGEGRFAEC